ncbi:MAG TPA: peptide chain release factor 1 [Tissierellaceae bacterium]|nr:peptide chain release factor 1 [Tissierellaceae bacterium]
MLEKLDFVEQKYKELTERMLDPDLLNDMKEYQNVMKEHAEVEPIVMKYRKYKELIEELDGAKELFDDDLDEDMREMVREEINELEESIADLEEELKILLIPKDPNDHKNVIVEIRAGAGGEEAALFAGVLFRMYSMYSEKNNWKIEIMSSNGTGIGGYKEIVFMIKGEGAYSRLKYESGVHRVQRVPETESSGRIHTSTATVAVLPEAEDVDVEISQNDLKIDTYRASGAGGQHVNMTDSAVRITHLPTGIVVSCQDEKSQIKNRQQAMKILKTRVFDMMISEQEAEIAQERKGQVGTGDRSERIRTYNYPQGRVTDHRINLTVHRFEDLLNGDLDEVIDALVTTDQAEKMKN